MTEQNTIIIGYIHICQKEGWKRSFTMLMDCIKKSGLYDKVSVIRLGILSDTDEYDIDMLTDLKFKIVYKGKSAEYERPTLLHLQNSSNTDDENTKYFYLHTKGLSHFNTPKEENVLDWINLMLFWNIEKWKFAVKTLDTYDTYGCEAIQYMHYSGNFWWCTSKYAKTLPQHIGPKYIDPENWIFKSNGKKYNAFNSGIRGSEHYYKPYPKKNYEHL